MQRYLSRMARQWHSPPLPHGTGCPFSSTSHIAHWLEGDTPRDPASRTPQRLGTQSPSTSTPTLASDYRSTPCPAGPMGAGHPPGPGLGFRALSLPSAQPCPGLWPLGTRAPDRKASRAAAMTTPGHMMRDCGPRQGLQSEGAGEVTEEFWAQQEFEEGEASQGQGLDKAHGWKRQCRDTSRPPPPRP